VSHIGPEKPIPDETTAEEPAVEDVTPEPSVAEEPVPAVAEEPVSGFFDLNNPAQRMEGFAEAKQALGRSGLVVMPTDTVYGLATDAFDPTGVRRLLRAKGRGRAMPTPVLIGSADTLRALATGLTDDIRALASAFWPGGLTLICRQQPSLRWDLGDSRSTVALRIPDQPDAIDLLSDNGPLAVSSANLTGHPAATTIAEAREMLGDSVDVYLDAGPSPGNIASTILDCTDDVLRVVRIGVVTVEALRSVVPSIVAPEEAHVSEDDADGDDDANTSRDSEG
jgi:tRNA threonylcarbamoyl adenosine modification protein (Sua5/YciO/YrdC/YwlC family)